MTLFEFLMVFVSIIVGLGVAEILTGIAQQVRYRDTSKGYWLHSCGVAFIFLALLQAWWELWDLRVMPEWAFHSLVLMLAPPSILYLIAHLIFPQPVADSDFKQYYYGPMRTIWWLAILVTTSATLFRPLAFGFEIVNWDNASSVVLIAGFIVLGSSRNSMLHSMLVPALLALLLWDVIQWHPAFGPD